MPDSADLRAELADALAAAGRAWRVRICLHTFGEALRDAQGASLVPPAVAVHRAPACDRAKRAGGNEACKHHDLVVLPRDFAARHRAAWRTCHAGITELIVPVHHANRLEALLYLAPVGAVDAGRRTDLAAAACLLAGHLASVMRRLDQGRATGGDRRRTRIEAFLAARLAEDPGLPELAASLSLSTERTRHLVRELTGRSFRDVKDGHRLDRARRLLAESFDPVAAIGRRCGCADAAWFGRWFRRRTGMTPGAWRTRMREA